MFGLPMSGRCWLDTTHPIGRPHCSLCLSRVHLYASLLHSSLAAHRHLLDMPYPAPIPPERGLGATNVERSSTSACGGTAL
jgi:hypothetical protein